MYPSELGFSIIIFLLTGKLLAGKVFSNGSEEFEFKENSASARFLLSRYELQLPETKLLHLLM
jgi:hypothetical protein